jgi:hypothetical protein
MMDDTSHSNLEQVSMSVIKSLENIWFLKNPEYYLGKNVEFLPNWKNGFCTDLKPTKTLMSEGYPSEVDETTL